MTGDLLRWFFYWFALVDGTVGGYVSFSLALDPLDKLFYGHRLTAEIQTRTIGDVGNLKDVRIQLFIPSNLAFEAVISSNMCNLRTNQCSERPTVDVSQRSGVRVDKLHFNDVSASNVTALTIVANESWATDIVHTAVIKLMEVRTLEASRPRPVEFLIAWMTFKEAFYPPPFNGLSLNITNELQHDEQVTQKYIRRWFRFVPFDVDFTISDVSGDLSIGFGDNQTRINSAVNISIALTIERNALPATLIVTLPYENTTAEWCTPATAFIPAPIAQSSPVECRHETLVEPQLTVVGVWMTTGNGTTWVNFTQPDVGQLVDSAVIVHLNSSVTDLSCSATVLSATGKCKVNVTIIAEPNVGRIKLNKPLDVSLVVNYTSTKEGGDEEGKTKNGALAFVGPELFTSFLMNPRSQLEASVVSAASLTLRHSGRSTFNMSISSVKLLTEANSDLSVDSATSCLVQRSGGDKFGSRILTETCHSGRLSNPDGLSLGELKLGETVQLTFGVLCGPTVPIHSELLLKLIIEYGFAELVPPVCLPAPCLHGGVCVRGVVNKCVCSAGFYGSDCSKKRCYSGWMSAVDDPSLCHHLSDRLMSYTDAKSYCSRLSAKLLLLDTERKQQRFSSLTRSLLASTNNTSLGRDSQVWIELAAEAYPNNPPLRCATTKLSDNTDLEWRIRPCLDKTAVVCQKKIVDGPGETFRRRVNYQLTTKRLRLGATRWWGAENAQLGVAVHQPIDIQARLEPLPRGRLPNIIMLADFKATNASSSPLPIEYIATNAFLTTDKGSTQLQQKNNRRKRSSNSADIGNEVLHSAGRLKFRGHVQDIVNRDANSSLIIKAVFRGKTEVENHIDDEFTVDAALRVNGDVISLGGTSAMFVEPKLGIVKTIQPDEAHPGSALVTARVFHEPSSSAPAYHLRFTDDIQALHAVVVSPSTDGVDLNVSVDGGRLFANRSRLNVGEEFLIDYRLEATNRMKRGVPMISNATVTYKPGEIVPLDPKRQGVSTCLYLDEEVVIQSGPQQTPSVGATGVIVAAFGAFVLIFLLLIMWYQHKRSRDGLSADDMESVRSEIADNDKKGDNGSDTENNKTIVPLLTETSDERREERLERFGVRIATEADEMLDSHRRDILAAVSTSAVSRIDGTLASSLEKRLKATRDRFNSQYRAKIAVLEKQHERRTKKRVQFMKLNHKKELKTTGNEKDLSSVLKRHRKELRRLKRDLRLEHEAAVERLRQESFDEECKAMLEERQTVIRQLTDTGVIDNDEATRLETETDAQLSAVDGRFCDERTRYATLLEHRINIRRRFADTIVRRDSDPDGDIPTKVLEEQNGLVAELLAKGLIDADTAAELNAQANSLHEQLVDELRTNRTNSAKDLQNKWEAERNKRIRTLRERQKIEMDELIERSTDFGPVEALERRLAMMARHQQELVDTEATLDVEAALEEHWMDEALRRDIVQRFTHLCSPITQLDAANISPLVVDHATRLTVSADAFDERQQKAIDVVVENERHDRARLKDRCDSRMQALKEQRNDQMAVAQRLLDDAGAFDDLSEEERRRLLSLQRDQLSAMETTLAADRLAQTHTLTHKLRTRRATIVEHTQRQRLRRSTVSGSSADRSPTSAERVNTLEARLLRKRDAKVRQTEEMIGQRLAKYQFDKAKQVSEMTVQEKALRGVTAAMVEDLVDRGLLTNPDCQQIVSKHQQLQRRIAEKLNEQRGKQEKQLREQLEGRSLKRQQEHERRLKKEAEKAKQRPYSSYVSRQIAVMNQVLEGGRERQRIVDELYEQNERVMGSVRRAFLLEKQKALKEQEVGLAKHLIEIGEFQTSEIIPVLHMVFPTKTSQEIAEFSNELVGKHSFKPSTNAGTNLANRYSAMEEKHQFLKKRKRASSIKEKQLKQTSPAKKLPRIKSSSTSASSGGTTSDAARLPPLMRRPEPIGASSASSTITEQIPPKHMSSGRLSSVSFHK